jgi:hypothetical protein
MARLAGGISVDTVGVSRDLAGYWVAVGGTGDGWREGRTGRGGGAEMWGKSRSAGELAGSGWWGREEQGLVPGGAGRGLASPLWGKATPLRTNFLR